MYILVGIFLAVSLFAAFLTQRSPPLSITLSIPTPPLTTSLTHSLTNCVCI